MAVEKQRKCSRKRDTKSHEARHCPGHKSTTQVRILLSPRRDGSLSQIQHYTVSTHYRKKKRYGIKLLDEGNNVGVPGHKNC